LTGAAYGLVPVTAAVIVLLPPVRRFPLWALLIAPLSVFAVLKVVGRSQWGTTLPLTLIEAAIIAVTVILARWVSDGLEEFAQVVARLTIGRDHRLPDSFAEGQAEMYRELRRARHYERPLAVMSIGVEEDSLQIALDRMVRETQHAMMKQYVLSDVANTLCDELEDYNVIAQHDDHFLILLPEVKVEDLTDFVKRLQNGMYERSGVRLRVGVASFPDDAATFDGLVDCAEKGMDGKHLSECSPKAAHKAVESYYRSAA
jgi:GGDEF domain-containing protein